MSSQTKPQRVAATDARVHFGELVDSVAEDGEFFEVQRSDDFVIVLGPTEATEPVSKAFEAEAWLANLKRIQAEIRAYWDANPEARITESSLGIIRELRDSD